jgi:hypothetical protein
MSTTTVNSQVESLFDPISNIELPSATEVQQYPTIEETKECAWHAVEALDQLAIASKLGGLAHGLAVEPIRTRILGRYVKDPPRRESAVGGQERALRKAKDHFVCVLGTVARVGSDQPEEYTVDELDQKWQSFLERFSGHDKQEKRQKFIRSWTKKYKGLNGGVPMQRSTRAVNDESIPF